MESVTTCLASVAAEEAGRVQTVPSAVPQAGLGPGVSTNVSVITRQPAALWTGAASVSQASQATGKVTQIKVGYSWLRQKIILKFLI